MNINNNGIGAALHTTTNQVKAYGARAALMRAFTAKARPDLG